MVRFVVSPDHRLIPDLSAKLPGRGIWLSARRDVLQTACKKSVFGRAARTQVIVPPDLSEMICGGLVQRIADHLGFARRAGQAVAGFDKAGDWLASGRAGVVVQAADGSSAECSRFLGGWAGNVIRPLSAERLGTVFARERVVHVALLPGRLAQSVMVDAGRLAGFLGGRMNSERTDG